MLSLSIQKEEKYSGESKQKELIGKYSQKQFFGQIQKVHNSHIQINKENRLMYQDIDGSKMVSKIYVIIVLIDGQLHNLMQQL